MIYERHLPRVQARKSSSVSTAGATGNAALEFGSRLSFRPSIVPNWCPPRSLLQKFMMHLGSTSARY